MSCLEKFFHFLLFIDKGLNFRKHCTSKHKEFNFSTIFISSLSDLKHWRRSFRWDCKLFHTETTYWLIDESKGQNSNSHFKKIVETNIGALNTTTLLQQWVYVITTILLKKSQVSYRSAEIYEQHRFTYHWSYSKPCLYSAELASVAR